MTDQSYPGSAFHPDLGGKRGGGQLRLAAPSLIFEGRGHAFQLPLHGLRLRLGGAGDRLVFFTHQDYPEVSFYTEDHSILERPELASNPSLIAEVQKVRRRKRNLRLATGALIGALVAVLLGLFALKDPLVDLVVDRIPPELEVRLGELVWSQVRASSALVEDSDVQADFEALAAPILGAVESPYDFKLHVVEDSTVNAFALPGGHVVFHSGLLLRAEDPEEVLGVLGHELAHVTERHSLRQMVGTAGLFLLVQSLLGDASGLVAIAADGGLQLLTLEFSRDFEREADDTGLETLRRAEIDPRGLVRFFQKLHDEQLEGEEALGEVLTLLSTHPTSLERIERLESELGGPDDGSTLRSPGRPALDFDAFQDRLRGADHPSSGTAPDAAGVSSETLPTPEDISG